MTHQPLRFVVNRPDQSSTEDIELHSPGTGGMHIHLHLGGAAPIATPPAISLTPTAEGRLGKGRWKPWLIAGAGVAIAILSFDFGARSGEGHARSAMALANASNLAAGLSSQPGGGAPGDLPPSVRELLAQKPTVTPPTPPAQPAAGASPFGLHP
jgi:hypothetical protein